MRFSPGWKISVTVLALLPLLVSLGNWQGRRADEKRDILGKIDQRRAVPPVQFGKLDGNSVTYCVLNGNAASLVLVSLLFSDFNLASAIIQIVWITVSLCGLYRYWKAHRANTSRRQKDHHPAGYRVYQ